MTITEQMHAEIRKAGLSINELARRCGIPQPTITRFLNGADSKCSTLDRLAEYFGLELAPTAAARGQAAPKKAPAKAKRSPAGKAAKR